MADLWIPTWERVPYVGLGGGTFTDLDNPKLLWHTWEGDSWASAESVGGWARYPPHCGAHRTDRIVRQYVPLNKSAYSLGNTAAEHEYVIQVEVNGFARESHDWSDDDMDWLRSAVLEPIEQATGVPRIVVPQGFHGEGEGIVLAVKGSPIRFASVADLRAFSGHMGHQHSPGDDHWDPGRFRIDYLLASPLPVAPPKPSPKDIDMLVIQYKGGDYLLHAGKLAPLSVVAPKEVPRLAADDRQWDFLTKAFGQPVT